MNYLNENNNNLEVFAKEKKDEYSRAKPFPHIVIDNLFNEQLLNNILNEFPSNIEGIKYTGAY